ncbi:hypothetical protein [Geomesophilobacter sediminis]|uniref:Uncharacterized protein n=1 Tax=Geomesophilobacter sediminis TaxID=2798584 RepID=A0A8J7IX83_9BACT|nr:hypothetical protein [Geomesophilobacter sediminis]MBJ6724412.1 hypothetical protein [Geomesophilobacter sediminis]
MTIKSPVVLRQDEMRHGGKEGRGQRRLRTVRSEAGHPRMRARGALLAAVLWLTLLPVPAAHAVSDCVYGGTNFSDGALACQSGFQFRCSNGTWEGLDLTCNEPPPAPTRSKPAECACTANDEFNCSAVDMICCVTLEGDGCVKRCCQRP